MLLGYYLLPPILVLLLLVPRKYAAITFLGAAIFIPMGASIMLGPFNFFPVRLFVVTGIVRCLIRQESPGLFRAPADRLFIVFALAAVATSFFSHPDVKAAFVYHVALSLDILGIYFLFRTWISDWDDVLRFMRATLVFLVPLAFFMVLEFATGHNVFNYVGGIPLESALRGDRVRARGPFRHSILAGTYGAVALPFAVGLWRSNRRLAQIGIAGAVLVVLASTSGGPVMTLGSVIVALCMWRFRARLRAIVWWGVCCLVLLHLVMKAPVWYLIARIDIGGGGYYRAKLIDSAIKYLNEWWLAGSDYTRHWMPSGISWSPDAADITNEYLRFGVVGGLPLMLSFIAIVVVSYKQLCKAFQFLPEADIRRRFFVWCIGATLFGHTVSFLSMDYYDQSIAISISLFALIASGCKAIQSERSMEPEPEPISHESALDSLAFSRSW
jgi:hypothetical protein